MFLKGNSCILGFASSAGEHVIIVTEFMDSPYHGFHSRVPQINWLSIMVTMEIAKKGLSRNPSVSHTHIEKNIRLLSDTIRYSCHLMYSVWISSGFPLDFLWISSYPLHLFSAPDCAPACPAHASFWGSTSSRNKKSG